MRFRGRCMEQVRVIRFFEEAGGGNSRDHTSRASGAPGSRVLFDAGRSCHRRPSSFLGRAAGRDAPLERLEQPW
jgi:hypothetical protein